METQEELPKSTQSDLLARIDGSVREVVEGVVRIHDEVGKAVARTVKAGTFGAVDPAVDRLQAAEAEVVKSVGEGFKQASSVVANTVRRVGQRLRGEAKE